MNSNTGVVVVTHEFDPTADYVVEELNRRDVTVTRFDVAQFPRTLAVVATLTDSENENDGSGRGGVQWRGRIDGPVRGFRLDTVTGLYYRRPTGFALDPQMSEGERHWALAQARLGLGGLLAVFEPWLNHPHRIGFAEYKPVQLQLAARHGLRPPRTLVTNDPLAAWAFVTDQGRAVCKPFGGTGVHDTDGFRQVFASVVTPADCDTTSISATMHLFQQLVPKAYDVRLTVVDGRFFAARIDAHTEATHLDWRTDYDNISYQIVTTPEGVADAVTRFMDALGLRFAAFDFSVDLDGDWWFLECNPNGQWAWIEDATGLPITAALADALQKGPQS